ncbi:DUF3256 family protein [Proteiniphilum acetatigenes]|uniref:DUF3256 family protein n=1 Tax=Proteiniphilum acetatigenes TaxID=294710 RepID=UPI0003A3FB02|nr:DUF3256 family protein [Proteiniphilum acetatigenes]SFK95719.1 Protein of unknown function [Porphyromonadaceae bacterium KH3CP3RA]
MRNFIWIFFLSVSLVAEGQNIGDLFKSMPSELLPGVSEGNKTMLLVDSGETTVPYALGEIKKLEQSSDYLKIKTSDAGTTQLKMLPVAKDSSIVCIIKTVCAEACDSHISFYTTEWKKIENNSFLPELTKEIFFDSSKKEMKNYKYAVSLHHIYPISAEFNESGSDLMLTFNYKALLTDGQIAEIKPFLKSDTVTFKWENAVFRQ